MCGAGGFNRDGITDTVRTKVIDVFFKEHFAKTKKTTRFTTVGLGEEATTRMIRQHRRCSKLAGCSRKCARIVYRHLLFPTMPCIDRHQSH
jgi:uncharacterized metal-binding protein